LIVELVGAIIANRCGETIRAKPLERHGRQGYTCPDLGVEESDFESNGSVLKFCPKKGSGKPAAGKSKLAESTASS
jgi:hypothetical protein